VTPYEIGILLHYYCRCDDHEDMHRNPPVWRTTIERFIEDGLLRACTAEEERQRAANKTYVPQYYRATERLHAYCDALRTVPLPRQVWTVEWPTGLDRQDAQKVSA
jgi:hypothetical protein